MSALVLEASAKLNLYLHLLGKRADGYHLLESLVVFTSLSDTLTFTPARELSLLTQGEFAAFAGDPSTNLVMRAARALQHATGTTHGVAMVLEKRIPVGAGLGGGSSDAAAALLGLNRLWRLGLTHEQLHPIAVTLGADVAMCLAPTPAIVRGIGEEIVPLGAALPPLWALLVHPRIPLLTKDVYARAQVGEMISTPSFADDHLTAKYFLAKLMPTRNHLQRAAIAANPLVAEVLLALETAMPAPLFVRMTGSGACCFALYASQADATRAHDMLHAEHPQWWSSVGEVRPR